MRGTAGGYSRLHEAGHYMRFDMKLICDKRMGIAGFGIWMSRRIKTDTSRAVPLNLPLPRGRGHIQACCMHGSKDAICESPSAHCLALNGCRRPSLSQCCHCDPSGHLAASTPQVHSRSRSPRESKDKPAARCIDESSRVEESIGQGSGLYSTATRADLLYGSVKARI